MKLPSQHSVVRRLSCALMLTGMLALGGCASMPLRVSDRLFFGRSMPGGAQVTDAEWNAFVKTEIVPRFPEGFTVWRGSGHWKGDDGTAVSEQACVLEVVHRPGSATNTKISEIAQAYRQRFNQDAVMRIRTRAHQTFYTR